MIKTLMGSGVVTHPRVVDHSGLQKLLAWYSVTVTLDMRPAQALQVAVRGKMVTVERYSLPAAKKVKKVGVLPLVLQKFPRLPSVQEEHV